MGYLHEQVDFRIPRAGVIRCRLNLVAQLYKFSITLAGLPPAITLEGILLVTIEPLAITELRPTVTPLNIFTFDPIKTLSSITTAAASSEELIFLLSGANP